MPGKGTKPTQIRIPLDLKADAREKAAAEATTLSDVVVRLLREWVAQQRNSEHLGLGNM